MVHFRLLLMSAVVLSIGPAFTTAADDPAELFDKLFGDQVKAVSATRDAADDTALAMQMLETLDSLNESPDLQRLICVRAYDLAVGDPEGIDAAVASMHRLAALDPDQTLASQDRIVRALTIAHARTRGDERDAVADRLADALEKSGDLHAGGDDVTASIPLYRRAHAIAGRDDAERADRLRDKIETATAKSQTMRRIEQYKQRVKQNPNDRKAGHELVMAYIVDLDRPEAAAKYSFLVDEELAGRVRLAEKPIASVSPEDSYDLAKWYDGLSSNGPSTVKFAMLNRAAGYYRRFIESDPSDASALTVARVKLTRVETQLAELEGVEDDDAKGGWRPLMGESDKLVGWRLPQENGAFEYKGGVLTMGTGVTLTRPIDFANFALRGSFTLAEKGAARIGVRGSADKHYQINLRPSMIRLLRYERSVGKDLGFSKAKVRAGETYGFELIAAGPRLILRVDGQVIVDTTDNEFSEPGDLVLLTNSKEGKWKVSDFQVRKLSKSDVARYNKK